MKLLGDKILVRITKENRESIFSKEITRDDGTKVKLFINTPAQDDMDERKSRLFVQTGIVEAISDEVKGVKVGDIALLDYQLCNSVANFFSKDDNGEVFWLNATTTYHESDFVAYQTRRSKRDQIVHSRGDINELSMLLGIIRGDKLIAREPYCFFIHLPITRIITSETGIEYQEKDTILRRKVLAISEESSKKFNINIDDNVLVDDRDIFMVEYDGKKIDCIQAEDILATEELMTAISGFKELRPV